MLVVFSVEACSSCSLLIEDGRIEGVTTELKSVVSPNNGKVVSVLDLHQHAMI